MLERRRELSYTFMSFIVIDTLDQTTESTKQIAANSKINDHISTRR